jgi:hypothetical protein
MINHKKFYSMNTQEYKMYIMYGNIVIDSVFSYYNAFKNNYHYLYITTHFAGDATLWHIMRFRYSVMIVVFGFYKFNDVLKYNYPYSICMSEIL